MIDRREFIKKAGRGLFLGGLLSGSAYLLLKPVTDEECNYSFVCKNCRQLKSCNLTEADDFRKENKSNQYK